MHIWGFNLHVRETNQAVVCAPACSSALPAVSHQSRALTNFGKPGRDRLHSASLRAVKQPTWSCSVISACQKHDVMLKSEGTVMPRDGEAGYLILTLL